MDDLDLKRLQHILNCVMLFIELIVEYLLSYTASHRCTMSMGMRNLAIQDFQLSASTAMSENPPSESRPHGVGWCGKFTERHSYLQVITKCIGTRLSQTNQLHKEITFIFMYIGNHL